MFTLHRQSDAFWNSESMITLNHDTRIWGATYSRIVVVVVLFLLNWFLHKLLLYSAFYTFGKDIYLVQNFGTNSELIINLWSLRIFRQRVLIAILLLLFLLYFGGVGFCVNSYYFIYADFQRFEKIYLLQNLGQTVNLYDIAYSNFAQGKWIWFFTIERQYFCELFVSLGLLEMEETAFPD